MDERSEKRNTRSKPWSENSSTMRDYPKATANKGQKYIEIHYEMSLPRDLWLECKPKKYVTNYRYGNHYELRDQRLKSSRGAVSSAHRSPGYKFLWENNCQLWLMENLSSVQFNNQAKRIEEQNPESKRKTNVSDTNAFTRYALLSDLCQSYLIY